MTRLNALAITALFSITLVFGFSSCKKKGCTNSSATNYDSEAKKDDGSCVLPDDNNNNNGTTGTTDISILASNFYNSNVTFTVGTQYITISTNNEPDHKSMYYPTSHALYEAYSEPSNPDFFKNPNTISAQNYVFTIPRYPAEATTKTATDFDAIGVAINGVVFYNQVAAPGDDIMDEVHSFDQYEGHPTNTGSYHHHTEPVYLTGIKGNDALIGILLDGFPIYGPYEAGVKLTNDNLDDYHGHFSATAEFPDGIYHYHATDDLPWLNGGEYYGTAGSFTN